MNREMENQKRIQILSVTNYLVPRVALEKDALERAGYRVDVLYRRSVLWNIGTVISIPVYYAKMLRTCLRRDVWAVHVTNIIQLPLSPILKIGKKTVVYDAYERYSLDISERHFKGPLKRLVRFLVEFIEDLIIKYFVDAVLVVSTPDEYLCRRYEQKCKLVRCLYNVPSLKSVFGGDLAQRFCSGRLKIAYAGVISYDRGANKFIPLARALRNRKVNFELHLIGRYSNERNRQKIVSAIETFNLSDCVVCHGHMEYSSMMRLLCDCHVGLNLTSSTDRLAMIGVGASRKNFTYMSAGLVVLTTDVGEMAYATRQQKAGIILGDSINLDEVASIIEKLGRERKRCVELSKNAINAVRSKYNWENEERKLLLTYEKLFSEHFNEAAVFSGMQDALSC